jgi:hypothetical protein
MISPILERWYADCPFWPVEPGEFYLAVPRTPTLGQVGALAWALVARGVTDADGEVVASDAVGVVEVFLAGDADEFHAPGGLRVAGGGVVVEPGCCFGLEEWRDWLDVLDGQVVWLGHSPDVQVQQLGPVVRVWRDEALVDPKFTGAHVDVPRDALPGLLRDVRLDLTGFLDALGTWARHVVPDQADRFITTVDHRLRITAAL